MLPRPSRLDTARMAALFRGGRRSVNGPWLVFSQPNRTETTRFGFVATAKTFPTAAERHRAKRVAREAVRFCLSQIPAGYDIIIMYRFRPESWDFSRLSSQLARTLTALRPPGQSVTGQASDTDQH